jgi:predicted transcriptional regulator
MAETTTITIEVPKATAEELAELARSSNRSAAALAQEALDRFLEVESWHRRAIREAIAEADAGGPFVAHEDMERWLDSWGSENELDPPEPTVRR